jgi:anti-sigma regulatory factor (Ser/Thr protein kinase)
MELALVPRPESVRTARSAVDELDPSLSPEVREDIRLLVSELVTNSIRHGGLRSDQEITLRLDVSPGVARVEVRDPGLGFSSRSAPREDLGGWGLLLTETLASRWGITSDPTATRVWFEKELRGASMPSL